MDLAAGNSLKQWMPQILLLAVVVIVFLATLNWRRRQGRRAGQPFRCPQCGYDLRGSITSGSMKPGTVTCPECGSTYD